MRNRVRNVTVILLIAISTSYILAAIRTDSPEQLVAELQHAANDRHAESFLSRLTKESRKIVETADADRVVLREVHAGFENALDEKFGKGTGWIRDQDAESDLNAAITRISAVELVSKTE